MPGASLKLPAIVIFAKFQGFEPFVYVQRSLKQLLRFSLKKTRTLISGSGVCDDG